MSSARGAALLDLPDAALEKVFRLCASDEKALRALPLLDKGTHALLGRLRLPLGRCVAKTAAAAARQATAESRGWDLFACELLSGEDLWRLALCPALSSLVLRDPRARDLSGLTGCRFLSSLDVSGTEVADLSPLAECVALRELDVSRCERAEELGPLGRCAGLRTADAANHLEVVVE